MNWRHSGRLLFAAMIGSLLSVLAVGVLTFHAVEEAAESKRDRCLRAVSARADHRSMWEYLLATTDHPDDAKTIAFARVLDERLPRLECKGNDPVPVEEP
jgi:hypothetical protein